MSAASSWAASFYRIVDGDRPSARQAAVDRYIYGADILYTGDVKRGQGPIRVEGTVWHANLAEAKYFVGTHNPVIEQRAMMELIQDDKWAEAKLLMRHVPDAFPKSELLAELFDELGIERKSSQLSILSQALRDRYPEGYFLKPISGFNSAGTFPSETSDFEVLYRNYLEELKPKMRAFIKKTGDPVAAHYKFKGHPYYAGRVIEDLLRKPETVLIQAKINPSFSGMKRKPDGSFESLIDEYRVHVLEGKVLLGGTQHRWEDARAVNPETLAKVERFSQSLVDRLPEPLRKMCFGLDIMKTAEGAFKVIELNPGGESGYLYPDTDIWVTQLLAEHYRGQPTELISEIEHIKHARSFEERSIRLKDLLERPEIKKLAPHVEPITELLSQTKDAFIADLAAAPHYSLAVKTAAAIKELSLVPYLSNADLMLLASTLRGGGAHSLPEISRMIGLSESDMLYLEPRQASLGILNGLLYDDRMVEQEFVRQVERELAGAKAHPHGIRGQIEQIASRRIVTGWELSRGLVSGEEVVRNLSETHGRALYHGTRASLVEMALKSLLK